MSTRAPLPNGIYTLRHFSTDSNIRLNPFREKVYARTVKRWQTASLTRWYPNPIAFIDSTNLEMMYMKDLMTLRSN